MIRQKRWPSATPLVAFILIAAPIVYVLSYAPVVHVCGRTVETRISLDIPFRQDTLITGSFADFAVSDGSQAVIQQQLADSSLYPLYRPVDWLVDHTPFRSPLLSWAHLWGVRAAFDLSKTDRMLLDR